MRHDCRRWLLRGVKCPHAELQAEAGAPLDFDFDEEVPTLRLALYGAKTAEVRLGEQLMASALIADAAMETFGLDARQWPRTFNGQIGVPWEPLRTPLIPLQPFPVFGRQNNWILTVLAIGAAAVLGLATFVPGTHWAATGSATWAALLTNAW